MIGATVATWAMHGNGPMPSASRSAAVKTPRTPGIALAAAVAANAMPGESTVRGWHSVAVSYPRFADDQHGRTTLRLIGPTGEESPPVLAYVDLTKGTFGRGRNLEPLRLQLPKDFQLADNTPALVAFELEEMDRAAAAEEMDP